MNQVEKEKEFCKNFSIQTKTTKLSENSNSKQQDSCRLQSIFNKLFGKKNPTDFDSKSDVKPLQLDNNAEVMKKYDQDLQLAYYSDLQEFSNTLKIKSVKLSLISINSTNLQSKEIDFGQFYLYFILKMHEITSSKYYLELLIEDVDKAFYTNMLQIYEKLPPKYHDNAQAIYVLNTGVNVKNQTLADWSKNSRIQSKIKILNPEDLPNEPIFKALTEEQDTNQKNQLAESSNEDTNTTPINFFKKSMTEHELQNNIPVPLLKLARFFLSNREFTSKVGIFRINSTKAEEEQIERIFAKKDYDKLLEIKDPFVIANCIKKIFRDLEPKLISEERLEQLTELMEKTKFEDIEALNAELILWEAPTRQTFIFIIQLLDALTLQSENKMTHYNFAVVFAPNLMQIKPNDLGITGLAIAVLNSILSVCRKAFPEPADECLIEFKASLQ